jgi:hypothetical protein
LVEAGTITVAQFELADAEIGDLQAAGAEWAITERWNENSPLRRAAVAALVHLKVRGISPLRVRLQGQDIAPPLGVTIVTGTSSR